MIRSRGWRASGSSVGGDRSLHLQMTHGAGTVQSRELIKAPYRVAQVKRSSSPPLQVMQRLETITRIRPSTVKQRETHIRLEHCAD